MGETQVKGHSAHMLEIARAVKVSVALLAHVAILQVVQVAMGVSDPGPAETVVAAITDEQMVGLMVMIHQVIPRGAIKVARRALEVTV